MQNNNEYSDKRIGQILIDMHLATNNDIITALTIAKRERSKTGTTLVKMGVITLEQLKTVLKLQLGYDVVTEEQISSITPETISILPEDFIKMYQVIPISCDGKNLIVGMVNPNDNAAISNIIAFTGMIPVRLILTLYEFKELIQRLYNSEMKTNVINDNIRKIDL